MAYEQFNAKAPGSIMLFGEHAVLQGKNAIVCAVDKWVTVKLTPREDMKVSISSAFLGEYKSELPYLRIQPPFQYILAAILSLRQEMKTGCDIDIESEFAPTLGLGSSAAVTVACVASMAKWLNITFSNQELFMHCLKIVHKVQGAGSGADLAASIFGRVIAYRNNPIYISKLNAVPDLHLIYSGYKTPTPEVIQFVAEKAEKQPVLFNNVIDSIGICSETAIDAIQKKAWPLLGELMNVHFGLQKALGLATPAILEIIASLHQQPGILGCKISGAGLGDCVVALGKLDETSLMNKVQQKFPETQLIPVNISTEGFTVN